MTDPTKAFTKNPFVDKMMSWIPQDPKTQSLYMYTLTAIVFLGLMGYAITSWYSLFTNPFQLRVLFSSLFMSAIAMLSVVGLKQTRDNYHLIKAVYSQSQVPINVESTKEMMEGFNEKKV